MLNIDSYYQRQLKKIVFWGGLLRFVFLFFVIVVFENSISPYIMSDDIAYEKAAKDYLQNAYLILDIRTAEAIAEGYLEVFWPLVMCVFAKFFNTVYAGRIINCFLSIYCIRLVYCLTELVCHRKDAALKAAKLFAFLPYPWIICCFPIKDIFLSVVVLYVFIIFVKFQNSIKISLRQILVMIILLIAASFTRGGVVEFLGLVGATFIIASLINKKEWTRVVLVGTIGLVAFYFLEDNIFAAFKEKIDGYNTDKYISTGYLRYIQINQITDIWKLPITYFFAMIQPTTTSLSFLKLFSWDYLLGLLNISMYPIAYGNFVYAFKKKHNNLFWITSFLMYAGVFSLSLGIYRHYLFLFPFLMVNYACNWSLKKTFRGNSKMF